MRLLKIYILFQILAISLGSCKDMLDPINDNHSSVARVSSDPAYAEGLLITAYGRLPVNTLNGSDVATDDAVTNNKQDDNLKMANGQWSAIFNPVSEWDNSNGAIFYINKFLSIVDTVPWQSRSKVINKLFIQRLTGEAYALRGLFEYRLLMTVGGVGSNGQLIGIPIYNKFINFNENFNIPRASFTESVTQIYSDFDKALTYLVMDDYKNITSASNLPAGMTGIAPSDYNLVFGNVDMQRISGRIVKALKARVALLAASPAFNVDNNLSLWNTAATYADTVIQSAGGISSLDPNGYKFFNSVIVDKVRLPSADQKEMIWRQAIGTSNTWESDNYPPSLYGNGRINPTQNLVDAFPMKNGYPISHPLSLYNPSNPYANRDPRLALYILYNGSIMKAQTIITGQGGGINAKDSLANSTRTGYYLRKMIREDVNMNPVSTNTKKHYNVYMRYTEIFLTYAEAANEAWGPNGTGPSNFSARDVIAAIRKRAGISQPDNYLASISTTEDMRNLIHNERRLELCFEGFRFWDLRRWNVDLTEPAKGINIIGANYAVVNVEPRSYVNSFMHYGPIPYGEIIKFSALIQNKGW
jgi:hypothetical protein